MRERARQPPDYARSAAGGLDADDPAAGRARRRCRRRQQRAVDRGDGGVAQRMQQPRDAAQRPAWRERESAAAQCALPWYPPTTDATPPIAAAARPDEGAGRRPTVRAALPGVSAVIAPAGLLAVPPPKTSSRRPAPSRRRRGRRGEGADGAAGRDEATTDADEASAASRPPAATRPPTAARPQLHRGRQPARCDDAQRGRGAARRPDAPLSAGPRRRYCGGCRRPCRSPSGRAVWSRRCRRRSRRVRRRAPPLATAAPSASEQRLASFSSTSHAADDLSCSLTAA